MLELEFQNFFQTCTWRTHYLLKSTFYFFFTNTFNKCFLIYILRILRIFHWKKLVKSFWAAKVSRSTLTSFNFYVPTFFHSFAPVRKASRVRDRQTPKFWINCTDFYAILLNSFRVTLLPSYDASEDLDLGSFRTWPEIIPSLHHVRFIPWDLIPPCLSDEFEILQGPARRYPILSLFPFMSFLPSVYYGESRSCNDVCHPLFLSLGTGEIRCSPLDLRNRSFRNKIPIRFTIALTTGVRLLDKATFLKDDVQC
jgi:hypothetical protein